MQDMGLAVRIIPTMLIRGKSLVKGRQFKADRVIGHAQQAVRIHQRRGVDEMIVLNIDAPQGPDIALVEQLSSECFMPLTVGGGVRSIEDARLLLNAGADKIAICTGGPRLISECSTLLGSQAVVASVDVKDGKAVVRCGSCVTMQPAAGWARSCADHGAGEILLTSIEREGMMEGYDLNLIHQVSKDVSIPVIAHGGCGTPQHALEAIEAGASAVAIGAMFQFTDETPQSVAQYLSEHEIEVRLIQHTYAS